MRTLPLVVLAVLALSGCEQYREAQWQRAYNQKRALALKNGWTPARSPIYYEPRRQTRSDAPMMAGGPVMIPPPPMVIDASPLPMPSQQSAPQPVIVTGPNSGTTLVTQSSYGTVVSSFGGPLNLPPVPPPIYTGNPIPTIYTMPLEQ